MLTLFNTRNIYLCCLGKINSRRALSTSQLKEYYAILNVKKESTPKEIKDSFLKLSKVYHPDNKLTGSHNKFVKLKEAYDAIKNGPPAMSNSYSQNEQDYDLTHKAYARYREQQRNYHNTYEKEHRYGFGGPYGQSSTPWEDFLRDREYQRRRQNNERFSSPPGAAGRSLISVTIIFSAIAWIIIYSSVLLIFDIDHDSKKNMSAYRGRNYEDYLAYEEYLRRKELNRVMSNKRKVVTEPSVESQPSNEDTVIDEQKP